MKNVIAAGMVAAAIVLTAGSIAAQQDAAGDPPSKQPSATDKVTITGWALNMSNIAPGTNQDIQIEINKWSSPADRAKLIDIFLEKKQNGLKRALEHEPRLGKFRFPGYMGPDPNNIMSLGTDIHYAFSRPGEDGGRVIVVMTPRVIGFREAANQPRSYDYPFSLFEMRFGPDGKGEGKLAYATQVKFDKKNQQIELENYSSEPVRLNVLTLKERS
jgi:hypothetical protein